MTTYYLNGEPISQVDVGDRGLQYGDGFFTTIRVAQQRLVLWPQHWQRLCRSAEVLKFVDFAEQVDQAELAQQCQALVTAQGLNDGVVRITVTRGTAGRGYAPDPSAPIRLLVSLSPYPSHYKGWHQHGVRLQLSEQRLGYQPMLAGVKSLNRLEQVLLKHELASYPNADEILALDYQQQVAETSMANIAWQKAGRWHTPRLCGVGVRGLAMDVLIQHTDAMVDDYPLDALLDADHVIISNCLLGFVNVNSICVNATRTAQFSVLSNFTEQLTRRMCEGD